MFNLFRTREKLGKQTQSADEHNPIRRAAVEGQLNALSDRGYAADSVGGLFGYGKEETDFWRAKCAQNAEEVRRLSVALAKHNERYAKQMAGLKKATKASADKRRKV